MKNFDIKFKQQSTKSYNNPFTNFDPKALLSKNVVANNQLFQAPEADKPIVDPANLRAKSLLQKKKPKIKEIGFPKVNPKTGQPSSE